MSTSQTESPELDGPEVKAPAYTDNTDLLISIILATLGSSDDQAPETTIRTHSEERRSYSMEHFRWGKPPGRKRRPIKVFASSLEGGGSSEGSFPSHVRRQVSSLEDDTKGVVSRQSTESQAPQRQRVNSKPHVPVSSQDRKEGSYRMSHFRWGNPPVSKRGSLMKQLQEKPRRELARMLKNIVLKDVQRLSEWTERRRRQLQIVKDPLHVNNQRFWK